MTEEQGEQMLQILSGILDQLKRMDSKLSGIESYTSNIDQSNLDLRDIHNSITEVAAAIERGN